MRKIAGMAAIAAFVASLALFGGPLSADDAECVDDPATEVNECAEADAATE